MVDENDRIFEDVIYQQLLALRVVPSVYRVVAQELRTLERSLTGFIFDREIDASITLAQADQLIQETYQRINTRVQAELVDLSEISANRIRRVLKNTIIGQSIGEGAIEKVREFIRSRASQPSLTVQAHRVTGVLLSDSPVIPPQRLQSLVAETLIRGAPSSDWWARQNTTLQNAFKDVVRDGVLLGQPNSEIVRRVRGTKEFNYTDGIMHATRRNAEALVRTSVQASANEARLAVFEEVSDLVSAYQHVSTLDSRTSLICVARDGKRWKASEKKPIGHSIPFKTPPLHWNCRSTLVPELNGVALPDDATRSSQTGSVSATVTFNQYLRQRGKAFEDEVLGKGRADLWREGKITLTQLLNQSGNPLTLTELRQRYGE